MLETLLAFVAALTARPGEAAVRLAAALSVAFLVAFFGWALWTLWRLLIADGGQELQRLERGAYREHRAGQSTRRPSPGRPRA